MYTVMDKSKGFNCLYGSNQLRGAVGWGWGVGVITSVHTCHVTAVRLCYTAFSVFTLLVLNRCTHLAAGLYFVPAQFASMQPHSTCIPVFTYGLYWYKHVALFFIICICPWRVYISSVSVYPLYIGRRMYQPFCQLEQLEATRPRVKHRKAKVELSLPQYSASSSVLFIMM